MPVGYIDPDSGQYIYGTDDPRQPMSDVLNLAQNAARDAALADRERISSLEAWVGDYTAMTPWAEVPLETAYYSTSPLDNVWSSAAQPLAYRAIGDMVMVDGAVNTVATGGNHVGTLPVGYRPLRIVSFIYIFANDSLAQRGIIELDGKIRLSAGPPADGTDITFIIPPFFLV